MTIYLCNPDFEGILCGIYDAWMGLKGHDNVRLELREPIRRWSFSVNMWMWGRHLKRWER